MEKMKVGVVGATGMVGQRFLTLLENDPCERVIAFSHAGFITCTLTQVLGVSFNRKHIACPNASIAVFEYRDGRWILEQWGI